MPVGEQTVDSHCQARCTVAFEEHLIHHLPTVSQICNGFRDNDWTTDASLAVYTKFEEQVVENALHDVPVRWYARMGLESLSYLATCCGIRICIVTNEGTILVELSVLELCHDRRDEETRGLVEGEAGLDRVCAWNTTMSVKFSRQSSEQIPLSITIAFSLGFDALWRYASGWAGCHPLKGNSGAACMRGCERFVAPSGGGVGSLLSSTMRLTAVIAMLIRGSYEREGRVEVAARRIGVHRQHAPQKLGFKGFGECAHTFTE